MASSATIEHCTISRNGGWGIRREYYASPSISASVISENRGGGIWCWLYTCKVTSRGSIVARNENYDVSNGSPETWVFSGNWQSAADKQLLKSKGDTANLRSIHERLFCPDFSTRNQRVSGRASACGVGNCSCRARMQQAFCLQQRAKKSALTVGPAS